MEYVSNSGDTYYYFPSPNLPSPFYAPPPSLTPRGPTEEVSFQQEGEELRARMLEGKVERTKFADDFVPFDVAEDEANYQRPLSLMRTFIAEGTEDNLKMLRRRCKEEKVNQGLDDVCVCVNGCVCVCDF